jgi:hypothetical protein
LKTLETKKLFYRKYPYKVACRIQGGYYVARYGQDAVLKAMEWNKKYANNTYDYRVGGGTKLNYDDLDKFANLSRKYLVRDDIRVRAEGRHFNLFSMDKDTHEQIIKDLGNWVMEVTEPKNDKDLEYLLANKSVKVIVDQFPYEHYKYKIVLKSTMKADQRVRFNGWLNKYTEKDILVSSITTQRWMDDKKQWAQNPFIYVSDDGVRTLVELYLGANKSRTEEFVLRSTI